MPTLLSGQEARIERSVRSVYGHLLLARAAQQRYSEKDSASAAANDSAMVGWLRSAGVPALERVGRARYPQAIAGAEADVRRLQGMVNLTVRMAGSRYATMGEFLANALPWGKYEQDLARHGLRHLRTRQYTPRTNGKAERFIQTALREGAYAKPYRSSRRRAGALAVFLTSYNTTRPHTAHGRLPPMSRLQP